VWPLKGLIGVVVHLHRHVPIELCIGNSAEKEVEFGQVVNP